MIHKILNQNLRISLSLSDTDSLSLSRARYEGTCSQGYKLHTHTCPLLHILSTHVQQEGGRGQRKGRWKKRGKGGADQGKYVRVRHKAGRKRKGKRGKGRKGGMVKETMEGKEIMKGKGKEEGNERERGG